jgi:hypothetical protein
MGFYQPHGACHQGVSNPVSYVAVWLGQPGVMVDISRVHGVRNPLDHGKFWSPLPIHCWVFKQPWFMSQHHTGTTGWGGVVWSFQKETEQRDQSGSVLRRVGQMVLSPREHGDSMMIGWLGGSCHWLNRGLHRGLGIGTVTVLRWTF